MRKTERAGATPENVFSEITSGDAPCSIELTRNAKGDYQWSIKIYLADDHDLQARGALIVEHVDQQLRRKFLPTQEGK